jgi:hypothetical protein
LQQLPVEDVQTAVGPEAVDEVLAAGNPIAELVYGIKARKALVAKDPEEFPPRTRTGLVSAQAEAREELLVAEQNYAQYVKDAAVAGVITSSDPKRVQEFLALAQEVSAQPLVVVACDEMYDRLATAGEVGLGPTRQFGAGQLGIILEEYAAIGRELQFTSLASPRWSYDVIVPTHKDFVAAIRTAIRAGGDGDSMNRAFIRLQAYRKALEVGYSTSLVPVLIVGSSPEEAPFLQKQLFNVCVTIDLEPGEAPSAEVVKSFFKSMVKTAKRYDANQVQASAVV